MKRTSFALLLPILLLFSACTDVSHPKALIRDGEEVKIIDIKKTPGELVGTVAVTNLMKMVNIPETSTAFAINENKVFVINTQNLESVQTVTAPGDHLISDIFVRKVTPASESVPYVLLNNTETWIPWPGLFKYEKIMTLEKVEGTWQWDETIEWNEMTNPLEQLTPLQVVVAPDGGEAFVLAEDLLGINVKFFDVPITGAFDEREYAVATGVFGSDMTVSSDNAFAFVAHDVGLNVYSTGEAGDLVRAYGSEEIDAFKWGTGAKKIRLSKNDAFLYAATEGLLGIAGGGFAITGETLCAGGDLAAEDITDVGELNLPAGFEWLGELFASTMSYRDVEVIENVAHFVLTSITGAIPGMPNALHIVVQDNAIRGITVLEVEEEDSSTPERIAISNADAVLVTNSDGGYLDKILADPILGYLQSEVIHLADEHLADPSTIVLSTY